MTTTTMSFDTLSFSQTMREAGMNEKTANTLAEELKKLKEDDNVATKGDISLLRKDMQIMEERLLKEIKSTMLITVLSIGTIITLIEKVFT